MDRVEVNSTITPIGFRENARKVCIAEIAIKRHLVTICEDSGITAANRNRRKCPSPAMGYARRKPNTGNRSVRFDEEGMAKAIPLLYCSDGRSRASIRIAWARITAMDLKLGHPSKLSSYHHLYDRAWKERSVFRKIRYMSYGGAIKIWCQSVYLFNPSMKELFT